MFRSVMNKEEFIEKFVLNYVSVWCVNQNKNQSYHEFLESIDSQTYLANNMAKQCWKKLEEVKKY